jgi:hypothetical protein
MRFEMLLVNPAFERVVLPFKKNLERLPARAAWKPSPPIAFYHSQ